ncbi:KH domain-containing protein [Xylariaceae sp. FL0016]|nr:KH domain-containing protein [Xylariaceae sp. FL0016]
MQKLANMGMRHWSDRIQSPSAGMFSRPNPNMSMTPMNPHQKTGAPGAPPISPSPAADSTIHFSFNVPFASDLAGPNTEEILFATGGAVLKWTHPGDAPDDVPIYDLPVHAQHLVNLRTLCDKLTSGPLSIEAYVVSTTPKHLKGQVTTVCLTGAPELVHKSRETILSDSPLALRCATIDIKNSLIVDAATNSLKQHVTETLDTFAAFCGVDIFILGPKLQPPVDCLNGDVEIINDSRFRIAIFGDIESTEHAKTQVLIFIDKLLNRHLDVMHFESTLHPIVCGRSRKNIKLIESATNTAIYFPPFAQLYRYCPPKANRRNPDEIFITGENPQGIELAKRKIHELVNRTKLFMKDAVVAPSKIDSILLGRMDKVRKIMDTNGTYIMFPPLASQRNMIRVQGIEGLQIERTMKEIMSLAGQFYNSAWAIQQGPGALLPNPHEIRTLLGDICANSDADIAFDKMTFTITGSDDAVKSALPILSQVPFVMNAAAQQIRVKIELANEHKEFVSGKKNGKINKIMTQSNVQIMFESFREYNFDIDVIAPTYDSMKQGMTLVEQEMPASISFHVPDQYHKRIIGIGGQHIQRIMKKHSVFVKFSNAMDRGGMGREDDDVKVDNVICRTPARNAQNLELVKVEILDMVDRAHSEFTSQVVHVDRLYHRQLIARLEQIDELEKKWNCKIVFPSTEQASDEVTVTGPEWQVPLCADEFLGMVPETHELVLTRTPSLVKFLESPEFVNELVSKLKTQHEVNLEVHEHPEEKTDDGERTVTLVWKLTRNNAGGLRDAIEFLMQQFVASSVEANIVKGAIPRPKSDSFEDSLQYFDSKLLQHAPSVGTDSPTKPAFGDELSQQRSTTLFDKLRKPSQLLSSLDRRKNSSHSMNTFFKGSSNVSKSSLISIESTRSFNADRNPWNDSGVNLPDDDHNPWASRHIGNGFEKGLMPNIHGGDVTPRHNTRASGDSGRPSTSHSTNSGYPGPIGPFR